MAITCDPAKRAKTLTERGLDMLDCGEVFAGRVSTKVDDRRDYGETRLISAGHLRGRFVVIVWTPRGDNRHVISMRHGHGKEEERMG